MKSLITTLFAVCCFQVQIAVASDSLLIVSTASMIQDIAYNVIGDLHQLETIVPIGGDPHIYEPTPSDARLAADADIIFINGLTFEGWLNELIENSGTNAKVVTVTEHIDPIESSTYANAADPHAWMVAANGKKYAQSIYETISLIDPDNEDIYTFNFRLYKQQLSEVDSIIMAGINTIPEKKRVLVTSHDAFQYFGQAYGLKLESIIGTSTDAQAQTSDIIRVNKIIEESGIPAVFIESTINPKLLQQIAHDQQIVIGGKLYSDSLGDKESPVSTYIDMLLYNTRTIVEALSREREIATNPDRIISGPGRLLSYLLGGVFIIILVFFFLRQSKNV